MSDQSAKPPAFQWWLDWDLEDGESKDIPIRRTPICHDLEHIPPRSLLINPKSVKFRFLRLQLTELIDRALLSGDLEQVERVLRWVIIWWIVNTRPKLRAVWEKQDKKSDPNKMPEEKHIRGLSFREITDRALNLHTFEMIALHDYRTNCKQHFKSVWGPMTSNFEFYEIPKTQSVFGNGFSTVIESLGSEFPALRSLLLQTADSQGQSSLLISFLNYYRPAKLVYLFQAKPRQLRPKLSQANNYSQKAPLKSHNLYMLFKKGGSTKWQNHFLRPWIESGMPGAETPVASDLISRVVLPDSFSYLVMNRRMCIATIYWWRGNLQNRVITYGLWAYLLAPTELRKIMMPKIQDRDICLFVKYCKRKVKLERRGVPQGKVHFYLKRQYTLGSESEALVPLIYLCEHKNEAVRLLKAVEVHDSDPQLEDGIRLFSKMVLGSHSSDCKLPSRIKLENVELPRHPQSSANANFQSWISSWAYQSQSVDLPFLNFRNCSLLFANIYPLITHSTELSDIGLIEVKFFYGLITDNLKIGWDLYVPKTVVSHKIRLRDAVMAIGNMILNPQFVDRKAELQKKRESVYAQDIWQLGHLFYWKLDKILQIYRKSSAFLLGFAKSLTLSTHVSSESEILVGFTEAARAHKFTFHKYRSYSDPSCMIEWDTVLDLLITAANKNLSPKPDLHRPFEMFQKEWLEGIAKIAEEFRQQAPPSLEYVEERYRACLADFRDRGLLAYKAGLQYDEPKTFLLKFKPYMSQHGLHFCSQPHTVGDLASAIMRARPVGPAFVRRDAELLVSRLFEIGPRLERLASNSCDLDPVCQLAIDSLQKLHLEALKHYLPYTSLRAKRPLILGLIWRKKCDETGDFTLPPGIPPFCTLSKTYSTQRLKKIIRPSKFCCELPIPAIAHLKKDPFLVDSAISMAGLQNELASNLVSKVFALKLLDVSPIILVIRAIKTTACEALGRLHHTVRKLNALVGQLLVSLSTADKKDLQRHLLPLMDRLQFLLKPEYLFALQSRHQHADKTNKLAFLKNVLWKYYEQPALLRDQPSLKLLIEKVVHCCLLNRQQVLVAFLVRAIPSFWCVGHFPGQTLKDSETKETLPYAIFRELSFFLEEAAPERWEKTLNPKTSVRSVIRQSDVLSFGTFSISLKSPTLADELRELASKLGSRLLFSEGEQPNFKTVCILCRHLVLRRKLKEFWHVLEILCDLDTKNKSAFGSTLLGVLNHTEADEQSNILNITTTLSTLDLLFLFGRLSWAGQIFGDYISPLCQSLAADFKFDMSPLQWKPAPDQSPDTTVTRHPMHQQLAGPRASDPGSLPRLQSLLQQLHRQTSDRQNTQQQQQTGPTASVVRRLLHSPGRTRTETRDVDWLAQDKPLPEVGLLRELPVSVLVLRRLILKAKARSQFAWLGELQAWLKDFQSLGFGMPSCEVPSYEINWRAYAVAFCAPDLEDLDEFVLEEHRFFGKLDLSRISFTVVAQIYRGCILNWNFEAIIPPMNHPEIESSENWRQHNEFPSHNWPIKIRDLLQIGQPIEMKILPRKPWNFVIEDTSYTENHSEMRSDTSCDLLITPEPDYLEENLAIRPLDSSKYKFALPHYLKKLSQAQESDLDFSSNMRTASEQFIIWMSSLVSYLECLNGEYRGNYIFTYISDKYKESFLSNLLKMKPILTPNFTLEIFITLPNCVWRYFFQNPLEKTSKELSEPLASCKIEFEANIDFSVPIPPVISLTENFISSEEKLNSILPITPESWGGSWCRYVYLSKKSSAWATKKCSSLFRSLQEVVYAPLYERDPQLGAVLRGRPPIWPKLPTEKFPMTKLEFERLVWPSRGLVRPGAYLPDPFVTVQSTQTARTATRRSDINLPKLSLVEGSRPILALHPLISDHLIDCSDDANSKQKSSKIVDFDFREAAHPYFRCVRENKGACSGIAATSKIGSVTVGQTVTVWLKGFDEQIFLQTKVEFEDRGAISNQPVVTLRQKLYGESGTPEVCDADWKLILGEELLQEANWVCYKFTSLMSGRFTLACQSNTELYPILQVNFRPKKQLDPTKCFGVDESTPFKLSSLAALRQSMMDPAYLSNSLAQEGYVLLPGKSFYSNRNLLKPIRMKKAAVPEAGDPDRRWLNWRLEDFMESDDDENSMGPIEDRNHSNHEPVADKHDSDSQTKLTTGMIESVPVLVYPDFSSSKGNFSLTIALHDEYYNQISVAQLREGLRAEFVAVDSDDFDRGHKCALKVTGFRMQKSNLYNILIEFNFLEAESSQHFQMFHVLLYVQDVPLKYFTVIPTQQGLVDRVKKFRKSRAAVLTCYGGASLVINRTQVLPSILNVPRNSILIRATIHFKGEKGIDVGGPTREFFDLIGVEIEKGSMGTFILQEGLFNNSKRDAILGQLDSSLNSQNLELFYRLGIILGNSVRFNQFIGINLNKMAREVLISGPDTKPESVVLNHFGVKKPAVCSLMTKLREGFRESLHRVPEFFSTFTEQELTYFFTGRSEGIEFTPQLLRQSLNVQGPPEQVRLFDAALMTLNNEAAQGFWRALTGSSSIDTAEPIMGSVNLGLFNGRDLILHTCGRSATIGHCQSIQDMQAVILSCIDYSSSKSPGFNIG